MIKDCKNIKEIGNGMNGTVYSVKYKSKKYAMKVEHILKKNITETTSIPIWREIEFAKFMGSKYPMQFLTLYDNDIINDCTLKQKYPKVLMENMPDDLKLLNDSPYCSRKLYSWVDTTLDKVIDELNIQQIYSIIIQMAHIYYLMNKHGYTHSDTHLANVGLIKTNDSTINILEKTINLYGYQVVLIDYGLVLNKKYKLGSNSYKNEKMTFKNHTQYEALYMLLHIINKYHFFDKHNDKIDWDKGIKLFKKTEFSKRLNLILKCEYTKFMIFGILHQTKFQKLLLGGKFEKTVPNTLYVPKNDIKKIILCFPIKNTDDYLKIINYFYKKSTKLL